MTLSPWGFSFAFILSKVAKAITHSSPLSLYSLITP